MVSHTPVLREVFLRRLKGLIRDGMLSGGRPSAPGPFPGSAAYWECRYAQGGNSGDGSHGRLALFKAAVINQFVKELGIRSVVELGAGDGNQLSLLDLPSYTGMDVSHTAIEICRRRFEDDEKKRFVVLGADAIEIRADLALSLDVIFHLVEDEAYECYMKGLFSCAERYVLIYSSNLEMSGTAPHVRHREFTPYVRMIFPEWKLTETVSNPYKPQTYSDFFLYARL